MAFLCFATSTTTAEKMKFHRIMSQTQRAATSLSADPTGDRPSLMMMIEKITNFDAY